MASRVSKNAATARTARRVSGHYRHAFANDHGLPLSVTLEISDAGLAPIEFHNTQHFRIARSFALNPDGFMAGIMLDADEEEEQKD